MKRQVRSEKQKFAHAYNWFFRAQLRYKPWARYQTFYKEMKLPEDIKKLLKELNEAHNALKNLAEISYQRTKELNFGKE